MAYQKNGQFVDNTQKITAFEHSVLRWIHCFIFFIHDIPAGYSCIPTFERCQSLLIAQVSVAHRILGTPTGEDSLRSLSFLRLLREQFLYGIFGKYHSSAYFRFGATSFFHCGTHVNETFHFLMPVSWFAYGNDISYLSMTKILALYLLIDKPSVLLSLSYRSSRFSFWLLILYKG